MVEDSEQKADQQKSHFVLHETTLLIVICMLDMYVTLYLVRSGIAKEANPILRASLEHSNREFLILKGASFMIPLILIELIRPRNPQFVAKALRIAVACYCIVYVTAVVGLHWIP